MTQAKPSQPVLTTNNLILRKLEPGDWQMISYLRSDPAVNQFVERPKAHTKEAALGFIDKINRLQKKGATYYWCITLRGYAEMIGSICLWNFSEDGKTAELGYDLHPAKQGKGLMSEAVKTVLTFGFETLGFEQIEAFTEHDNKPSIALLRRFGFVLNPDRSDTDNPRNAIFELCRETADSRN